MRTQVLHRNNCLVQLEKSESVFWGWGFSSKRNELPIGIPDRTNTEWTAIPMQGEMGIKWNRQTTQISSE